MARNHRNRHQGGANGGGRSDLPALATDALPGIWSTWMQFGDITQRWTSLVQPWWQLPDLRAGDLPSQPGAAPPPGMLAAGLRCGGTGAAP